MNIEAAAADTKGGVGQVEKAAKSYIGKGATAKAKKAAAEEAAAKGYQFGDLTKSAVKSFTGKESYEFGDVTRTIGKKIFGGGGGGESSNQSQ